MKRTLTFLFLFIGAISIAFGQVRTLKGTVTSGQDGQPLPGVTVLIVGSSTGVITDGNGDFSIPFSGTSGKLQFSFVGMQQQTVDITSATVYNVVLQQDITALDEVVVTALGITREKKALGYAAQDISGDNLKRTAETNIVNALAGKSAGVYVQSASGNVGASSRIIIRGNSSLRDDNQPLFVVDGIPVDNSLTAMGGGMTSNDFGNAAADINPSDIAEMTILKGANAAALYGSRGANGVILITTKSGARRGFSVSVESSTTFSKPLILPEYQDKYGQGGFMQFWYKDGLNGGKYDGVDESYGPELDYTVKTEDIQPGGRLYWAIEAGFPQTPGQVLTLPQFNSPIDPNTGDRIPTPWISHPDNVKNFFVTGLTAINNVSLSSGGNWGNIRLSLTNSTQKGTVPNTDQKKNTISFSSLSKLNDKLSFEVRAQYMNIHSDNLPGAGYTFNNPMMQTIWGARQVDWEYMRDNIQRPDGTQITWIERWHDNPYWMQYKMLDPLTKNRLIGNALMKYEITDWLNFQVRAGTDYSSQQVERQRAWGGVSGGTREGWWEAYSTVRQEINADFLLAARKKVSEDFTIAGNFGGNIMNNKYQDQMTRVPKLVVPDIYAVSNAKEPATTSFYKSEREIQSLYGSFSMEYRNQIFFDLTGRNDWSSTLPPKNNSYFYPSATLSWIFSETLGLDKNMFTFGKLRVGWAQVGNDAGPYRLSQTYGSAMPFGTNPSFSLGNTLPPLDLKNELIDSKEVGADLRFFSNRVGLDVTLYTSSAKNQILSAVISNATGYSTSVINAGRIDNRGIEVMFKVTPVQANDFSWNIDLNWSKNKNQVVELNEQIESYELYKIYNQITVVAPVGGSYGTMMGKGYVYDDNGNMVVGANGIPKTSDIKEIGNIMPDWIGGMNNTFTYKNFSFGFLLDGRKGGDIFSRTNWDGFSTGVLATTVGLNDRGVEMREPVEAGGGINFGGVFEDGTPNNVYVEMEDARWNGFARGERFTYDASFIKLREMILTWSIPTEALRRFKVKAAEVSLFGRNMAILYSNVPNVDPEAATNSAALGSQGGEYGSIPPSRNIGFTLKLTF